MAKLGLTVVSILLGACAAVSSDSQRSSKPGALSGEMIHACECDPYCPCPFRKDATYATCRSLTVWMIDGGMVDGVDLRGMTFAASMTKAGKNVAEAKGAWEGVLLLPEGATDAQREAAENFVRRKHGEGFASLPVRVVPTSLNRAEREYHLTMGSVIALSVRAIPGAGGSVTRIDDPPSYPMGLGTLLCGVAEVHRYDDGNMQWDFEGRNAYYGPFAESD